LDVTSLATFEAEPAAAGRLLRSFERYLLATEDCDVTGIVSGHLFGTGNGVPGVPVPDFQVAAMYRLAWDRSPTAGEETRRVQGATCSAR
jgi:hypothetical protein